MTHRFQIGRLQPDATGGAISELSKWGKSVNFRKSSSVLDRSDLLCLWDIQAVMTSDQLAA